LKLRAVASRLLAGFLAILLTACASAPSTDGTLSKTERKKRYESRAAIIQMHQSWALDGKLAVSDGEDGGSGKLKWRTQPGLSELDFRGTFGRGAWQLAIRPGRSVLNLANGDTWEASDVSILVRKHVGWDVPVDALQWWVRGLAAPGRYSSRDIDDSGRLTLLSQDGWNVEYQRYQEFAGMALPTKLEARSGDHQVKLVMRSWNIPEDPENS
jgi:outer membrane lipoprotein LolB